MKSPPGSLEPSGGSSQDWQSPPSGSLESQAPKGSWVLWLRAGDEHSLICFFLFLSMNLQLYTPPPAPPPHHMQSISVHGACQTEPPVLCPDKGPSNICTLTWGRFIPGHRFSLWSQVNGTKPEVTEIFLTLVQCYAKSRCEATMRDMWLVSAGCWSLFIACPALKGIYFQPGVAKAAISSQRWFQICLTFTAM